MEQHCNNQLMKTFNQTITVEISVDDIAQQLLNTMEENYVHRELVVETIIATSLHAGNLTHLYNSLNGYTSEINFTPGQLIDCSKNIYQYVWEGDSVVSRHLPIGQCVVIDVDKYRDDKVKIQYYTMDRSGEKSSNEDWVSHLSCKYIPQGIDSRPTDVELVKHAEEAIKMM